MSEDIRQIVESTKTVLEHTAYEKFGAAVEGMTSGVLREIFQLPKSSDRLVAEAGDVAGEPGVWTGTRYAAALTQTDQVDYNPKLKFLFKVSFQFEDQILQNEDKLGLGVELKELQRDVGFMIRHIDRPKFDFDYEEVNLYNYRTKVLKQIRHRELAFTMYDDIGNKVLDFVNVYRKLLQPIARAEQDSSSNLGTRGFNFNTANSTSMRAPLPGGELEPFNILKKMTIHQIFVERGSRDDNPSNWVKVINFVFTNPRFTNIDIDDMDHENGGNFSLITMTADFDTMYMAHPENFTQESTPNLPSGDISADGEPGFGSGRNPFLDIIINQGARYGQTAITNAIHRALGGSTGGRIIAGQVGRVGGVLADAARRTLMGMGTGNTNGIAISGNSPVSDLNTPSAQIPDLSKQTFS